MMLPKAKSAQNDVLKWLEEFVAEAERLNRICKDMPHIVNVNEVFRTNGTAYYVMEFLDGGSLKDMVISKRGLSEPEALSFILPIARTIADLHKDHHIIHCDIKDDNIMMRKNEEDGTLFPVLIDFGESRHFNTDGSLTSKRSTIGGTAGYAPLEQTAGDITVQVDVYALAATLFCALTGNPPQVASSVTSDYIKAKLPENTSSCVKDAIIHAMQTNKHNRTATMADFVQEVMNGIVPPEKPDELPIGYILNSLGAYYRIASQGIKHADYIQYKAVRFTKKDSIGPVRAPKVDIYEFFVDGCHHRNDDMSVSFDSETSVAWQRYLKLCSEKTGNNIVHEFQTSKGEGWATFDPSGGTKKMKTSEDEAWATFEANNTSYLVWNKIRKPLPWRKIVTYSAIGIGSLLLVWGVVSIIQGINAAKERDRQEMSRRLTEAIASYDQAVIRDFAVEHDSTRAYLPYAMICMEAGDIETAKVFVVKKATSDSLINAPLDPLLAVLSHKIDSVVNVNQPNEDEETNKIEAVIGKEQAKDKNDSLYNAAVSLFSIGKAFEAKATIDKMDAGHSSRQDVKELLNKIDTELKRQEFEIKYTEYLSKAKTAYNNNRYSEATSYINKIKSELGDIYYKKNDVKNLESLITKETKYLNYLSSAKDALISNKCSDAATYVKKIRNELGESFAKRSEVVSLQAQIDECQTNNTDQKKLERALSQNDWTTVRSLALKGDCKTKASSKLAQHYIELAKRNGGNKENLCRAWYWSQRADSSTKAEIEDILDLYGFDENEHCENIKY